MSSAMSNRRIGKGEGERPSAEYKPATHACHLVPRHIHCIATSRSFTLAKLVICTYVYNVNFTYIYRVFFLTGTPPKSTNKLILARLGVSRPIYVNVDSPNQGFPYFNCLGGYHLKNIARIANAVQCHN